MRTSGERVDTARMADADAELFESFTRLGNEISQHEIEFYWPAQREAIELGDEVEASSDADRVTERLPEDTPPV